MAKSSNIVHQYFKREFEGVTILVKVNPLTFTGTEITVDADGKTETREIEFDENIFDDLAADNFLASSPIEFNLYHSGLI